MSGETDGDLQRYSGDQAGEHGIDFVEVRLELRQLCAGAHLRGGDAEIEVDVRIHA